MKRSSQAKIYAETKGMSIDEQLSYWKNPDQTFSRQLAKGKARTTRQLKTVKN